MGESHEYQVDLYDYSLLPDYPHKAIAGSLDIADWMERPGVRSVLLNFHASWCDACEEAKPKLQALRERYHSTGLRVITIHTNDSLVECGQGLFEVTS